MSSTVAFQELRKQWRESGPEEMSQTVEEQEMILREGVSLKLALSREEIAREAAQEGRDLDANEPEVSLLAALQQSQDQEAEYLIRDLAVKVTWLRKNLFITKNGKTCCLKYISQELSSRYIILLYIHILI